MAASEWPVTVDESFGCWLYDESKLDAAGYPIVWRGRHPVKAYLVIYESEIGPIGDGLVLDHVCKVRRCCRPAHLEPVTQSENLRRRSWRGQCRRTHCKKGHPLNINAMVLPGGGRACRLCSRSDEP